MLVVVVLKMWFWAPFLLSIPTAAIRLILQQSILWIKSIDKSKLIYQYNIYSSLKLRLQYDH